MRALCTIPGAHANNHRSMLMPHRVEVITRLEIPGNFLLSGLDDLFFLIIDDLLYLRCFLYDAIEPINTRDIRAKIQTQRGVVTEKSRDGESVFIIDQ